MKNKRILLVRDRDFFLYVHQLAVLLTQAGHEVDVLYTYSGSIEPLYADLLKQTQQTGARFHLVEDRSRWLVRRIMSVAYRLRLITKLATITPCKIRTAKKYLKPHPTFDYIITFDPPALFLAARIYPGSLSKIIHFSLEVIEETHPQFKNGRITKALRLYERRCLMQVGALMIQDRFRERVLKAKVPRECATPTIYYPVALPGGAHTRSPQKLVTWQQSFASRQVILFFGGLWSAELIEGLSRCSKSLGENQVIVVHGGRGCIRKFPSTTEQFIVSTEPIPFDSINDLIASAHIGLALYPDGDLNSKYTAFSSEKIARYTQCGIPFIAFNNEDYRHLKQLFNCCELVDSYDEIPSAAQRIFDSYSEYTGNAKAAFPHFYSLENTSKNLLEFVSAKS